MKRAEFLKKAIAAASMALGMMLMTNAYTSDVYAGTRYQWRTNNCEFRKNGAVIPRQRSDRSA